jgi:hypothetical protein
MVLMLVCFDSTNPLHWTTSSCSLNCSLASRPVLHARQHPAAAKLTLRLYSHVFASMPRSHSWKYFLNVPMLIHASVLCVSVHGHKRVTYRGVRRTKSHPTKYLFSSFENIVMARYWTTARQANNGCHYWVTTLQTRVYLSNNWKQQDRNGVFCAIHDET